MKPELFILAAIGLQHYLVLASVLFVCGVLSILLKRNAIGILMGVELILNAANVNLVAFNRFAYAGTAGQPLLSGQVFALFIIVLAAAEAAVALAIFLNFYNNFSTIDVEAGAKFTRIVQLFIEPETDRAELARL